MAGFQTKTFKKHDDYMTPKYAWENIQRFIPKDKIIWEAFYGDGESGKYLTELGFNTKHEPIDFFEDPPFDYECIISNPPYSQSQAVLTRLKALEKPFIMILPASKIATQYFRKLFDEDQIQIIIPRKRIHFMKLVDGKRPENWKNACNFDCFYYCWKMNLSRDIIFNDIAVEMKPRITVKMLKEKLKQYNLSTKGKKAELIERLEFHSHTFQ